MTTQKRSIAQRVETALMCGLNLPDSVQHRVKVLIKHKLALDYDPTMVDPK
jgi:hypothetical protein